MFAINYHVPEEQMLYLDDYVDRPHEVLNVHSWQENGEKRLNTTHCEFC